MRSPLSDIRGLEKVRTIDRPNAAVSGVFHRRRPRMFTTGRSVIVDRLAFEFMAADLGVHSTRAR